MSAELLPVWAEIEKYIDAGIGVIAVRDKDDLYGLAKTPFGKTWKGENNSKEQLFEQMDVKFNTCAVGLKGGIKSGNLEIIDIDVKYKAGCDAALFSDLKTLYPALYKKLRIHKSPSGGYHILYRCESEVEGNQKLAARNATPEELLAHPKSKIYNFLETRGEGGYVVAPPAMGYTVVKDVPIPIISLADRNSIVSLCKSYNEIIKIENTYKPSTVQTQYYDESPFDDFNNRVNPSELMAEFGWTELKSNNLFIWYTRPDKNKGISLSFNHAKRFFFCFTSSTELEADKGYSPCNLLALLKFNDDKKKLYAELVSRGYGKIKLKVEQQLAKKAATNGKPLPLNISTEAKSIHAAMSATLDQQHPHGVFWIDSFEHGIQIDRELLYNVADKLGFKLHNTVLVRVDGTYIDPVEDRYFFDTLKQYVQEEDADLYKDICNAYESFIERHGKFTISRLAILADDTILKDTKEISYKCYTNGILKIMCNNTQLLPTVPKLIWRKNIQPRDYNHGTGGRYIEFLKLATDFETNKDYLLTCMGFLAHEYKDETAGYILVLTEQCENPKDGGGAGKNVFSELFKKITSFVSKPGSQVKYDEKFMQSWNGQKIYCLSDVPKNFNFGFLKELSGGTGLMKKLFKDEVEIPSELMPKFLIQTNYSFEITDGGLKRRIKPIEFTDFFTKSGGVDVHFNGCHFPNEWNTEDWAGFDSIMALAIQKWLCNNRKIGSNHLSQSGWAKQFEQNWGQVITHFIKENFADWCAAQWVSNESFKSKLDEYYRENNTPPNYRPSSIKINNAIKAYCEHKQVQYLSDIPHKENSIVNKCRFFGSEESTPF